MQIVHCNHSGPRSLRRLSKGLVGLGLTALFALAPSASSNDDESDDGTELIRVLVGRSTQIQVDWPVKGVSLTDPEVSDVQVLTPRLISIIGLTTGITDCLLWGEEDDQLRELRIVIELDLTALELELGSMFPGVPFELRQSQGVTVVAGVLKNADQAAQLDAYLQAREIPYVNMTRVGGLHQVMVQVRVAEASRTSLRELGINFFRQSDNFIGGQVLGPSDGGPINPLNIGVPEGANALKSLPFEFLSAGAVAPSVTMFAAFPNSDIQVFIQALAENEYLRLLAEPNLVALSGEEATFLAGGEFPVPIVQGGSSDGTAITIEYKPFGVALAFRPIVLGDNTIRMTVGAEVSQLSEIGSVQIEGFDIPAVVTRNAQTTVELKSGQSFAMAGLLLNNVNSRTSRIPGLGDLPILGPLFRSVRYFNQETELVILVTATLVEPLSETGFPSLPGADHVIPNDWELYADGRIAGRSAPGLSEDSARWLHELGLSELKGPGAWMTHDQTIASSSTWTEDGMALADDDIAAAPAEGQVDGMTDVDGESAGDDAETDAAGAAGPAAEDENTDEESTEEAEGEAEADDDSSDIT